MLCSYSRATLRLCVFQKERVSVCLVKPIIGVPKPQCGQSQNGCANKSLCLRAWLEDAGRVAWLFFSHPLWLRSDRRTCFFALLLSPFLWNAWRTQVIVWQWDEGHTKRNQSFSVCVFRADIFSQISPKWEDEFFQARTLIWDVVALEELLFKKKKRTKKSSWFSEAWKVELLRRLQNQKQSCGR